MAASSSSVVPMALPQPTSNQSKPLFSIPADVVHQMKIGSPMIKVGSRGRPMRRHFRVSPDYRFLEWIPSRKGSEFVDLDQVDHLRIGMHGEAWEKFKGNPQYQQAARDLHWNQRNKKAERMSGWLHKKGGVKGGWANWTKRWFSLSGTQLTYSKSPDTAEEKGRISLEGVKVKDGSGLLFTLEFGPLRPTRELKADTLEDKRVWMKMLEEASAARIRTVVRRSEVSLDVDADRLAFSIIGTSKGRHTQLLCASLTEFEIWYGGLLLLVAARKKQLALAEAFFSAAVQRDNKDALSHMGMGRTYWKKGEYDKAIHYMQLATELGPDLKMPFVAISDVYTSHGDHANAAKNLHKAYRNAETDERVLLKLSRALLRLGRYDESIPILQKLLACDPYNPDAHCALGEALNESGMLDDAEAHFAAALKSNPKFVYAYVNLGLSQEKRGDLNAAIGHYTKAVEMAPNLTSAHLNLAAAYSRRDSASGDHLKAAEHYTRVTELDPDNWRPYVGAAHEYHRVNASEESWNMLESALARFEGIAEVHVAIGHFYQQLWMDSVDSSVLSSDFLNSNGPGLDRLEAAVDQYRKALGIKSSQIEAGLHLGVSLRRLGHLKESTDILKGAQTAVDDLMNQDAGAEADTELNGMADEIDAEFARSSKLLEMYGETAPADILGGPPRGNETAQSNGNSGAEGEKHDIPGHMPVFGALASVNRSALTADERSKLFFSEMKRAKEREESEKRAKELAALNMLSEDEKVAKQQAEQDAKMRQKRKDQMLKGQLGAYGASNRSVSIPGRGRGRGRGMNGGVHAT